LDFLAWRFTIATLILIAIRPSSFRKMTGGGVWRGMLLGVALGGGYIPPDLRIALHLCGGIRFYKPGCSWYYTGNVMDNFTAQDNVTVWIAVALATLGLGLLSLHGCSVGLGELLYPRQCRILYRPCGRCRRMVEKYDLYGLTILTNRKLWQFYRLSRAAGGVSGRTNLRLMPASGWPSG